MEVKLDNKRVKVTTVTYDPGVSREHYVRPSDQLIVFLDDCKYERKDPLTGETALRERRAGEVIWHEKGENAPILTNVGAQPYRTLLIEIK